MQKTLIIQLARFGDLLQTKRLAYSLCGRAEIHLCLDESLEPLGRLVFPATRGFVLHPVFAHGHASGDQLLARNAAVFKELAQHRFESVYNCNTSGMNAALAALFEPERIRGLRSDSGQVQKETWMQLAFRWTSERLLAPLNLADYWALFAPTPLAPALVNPQAKPGGKGLGVVLAGRMARRSLPPEVLAPIVRAMASRVPGRKGNTPVFFLGSASERSLARKVARLLPSSLEANAHDLTGKTDWPGLVGTLTGLDALVSPDTGTMHLAAHLGVPVTAFFLSSAWLWETGPYGLGHRIFQAAKNCLPCVETQACHHDVACLEPFKTPALLKTLSLPEGAESPAVPGIMRLASAFDELGLCWTARKADLEQDRAYASRLALRRLVGEYLGLAMPSLPPVTQGAAEFLFLERDWMLPPLSGATAPELRALD
jgi:ADP-heptose:LPS heptosyltransferase